MKIADIPDKFPIPFASAAGGSYIRPIPEASQIGIEGGAASLTDGFPPLNFQPRGAGGIPPFGEDFNGLLNQITAWTQWQNAGASVSWDSGFASSIGGYPKGAVLASSVTVGLFWISLTDDNATDPDSVTAANWVQNGRVKLNANATFYVSTTGSDVTGTGTALAPWQTIQKAWNTLQSSYDLSGFTATIQLADGNYAGANFVGGVVGSTSVASVVLNGNNATPANVTVGGLVVGVASLCTLQHYKMTGVTGVQAINSGQCSIGPGIIGAATNSNFYATNQGFIFVDNSYTSVGNKNTEYTISQGAIYLKVGITITFSGTPVFSAGVANVSQTGLLFIGGVVTFSGAVSGVSYAVASNAVIVLGGSTIPGSAGSTSTGGQVV